MTSLRTVMRRVLSGAADSSLRFEDVIRLLRKLGFDERVRGSHHTFVKIGVQEILNLQPNGAHAKAYQVRQIRDVIVRYRMGDAVTESPLDE